MLKKILLVGSCLVMFFNNCGNMGIATTIVEAEDNGPENGYYYYCEDLTSTHSKVWIDMDQTRPEDVFLYYKDNGKNIGIKLFSIK